MRIRTTLLTAALVVLASSCSVYNHSVDVSDLKTNAYSDDIYASLSVSADDKVEGKAKATFLFNFIQIGGGRHYAEIHQMDSDGVPLNNLINSFGNRGQRFRSLALGAAIKDSDYDIVLSPRYYTIKKSYLGIIKQYEVTVVGYGAKISSLTSVPHRYEGEIYVNENVQTSTPAGTVTTGNVQNTSPNSNVQMNLLKKK